MLQQHLLPSSNQQQQQHSPNTQQPPPPIHQQHDDYQQQQQQQLQTSSCNVSTTMNFWSNLGNRLSSLVCHCCERKLPDPENV